jgi:hypothetical protein
MKWKVGGGGGMISYVKLGEDSAKKMRHRITLSRRRASLPLHNCEKVLTKTSTERYRNQTFSESSSIYCYYDREMH